MDKGFLVRVSCMTFNHSAYIVDAMNGFAMQETTFPFVCTIIDDASNDGEPLVIKKYLQEHFDMDDRGIVGNEETDDYELIFARHNNNNNCFFAVYFLKYNHFSIKKAKMPYFQEWQKKVKYVAYCEGDDYWIDEKKLQKQVDFLESHPDYGLVHTDYMEYIQRYDKFRYKERNCIDGEITKYLISGVFFISAPTSCYRASTYSETNKDFIKESFLMGDLPLWIEMSRLTKVKYLSDKTSVYRVLDNSTAHSTSRLKKATFQLNLYEIRKYFIDKYGYDELRNINEHDFYYHKAIVLALQRKTKEAIAAFIKGHHFSLKEIKHFITRFIVKP